MQTYQQSFTAAQTWELNVPGRFFTVIASTNPVNIRLYHGGKLLDLGQITAIMAGIEIGGADQGVNFDRVQIDATAADTITVGIGNGQARYNRGNASVTVVANKVAQVTCANTQKTVTNASGQLMAANAGRQYLMIQNRDSTGAIYINWGASAATTANGIRIGPGETWESDAVVSTQAAQAIGDIASNANVLVVEA